MKFNIPHKSKQFFQQSAKLLITLLALLLMAQRIKGEQSVWGRWQLESGLELGMAISVFLLLAGINYIIQAKKWQVSSSDLQNKGLGLAFKEHFRAFAIAVVTPARIGEYAAKCFYFPKAAYKKVALRVLCENWSQMAATLFFGSLALLFTKDRAWPAFDGLLVTGLLLLLILVIALLWYYRHRLTFVKDLNVQSSDMPSKKQLGALMLWSHLRYLVFGSQYLLLLYLAELPYSLSELAIGIALLYLISSLLPSFALTDFTVKGLVLLYLLPKAELQQWSLLSAAFIMWLFNFALPALVGLCLMWWGKLGAKPAEAGLSEV